MAERKSSESAVQWSQQAGMLGVAVGAPQQTQGRFRLALDPDAMPTINATTNITKCQHYCPSAFRRTRKAGRFSTAGASSEKLASGPGAGTCGRGCQRVCRLGQLISKFRRPSHDPYRWSGWRADAAPSDRGAGGATYWLLGSQWPPTPLTLAMHCSRVTKPQFVAFPSPVL